VYATTAQIEHMLSKLDTSVPRLMTENDGMEFWIEYLQRADAIKQQTGLDHYEWVAERIDEIPVK
jgi:cephalosporin-C deacetylase-like acetyl esterase